MKYPKKLVKEARKLGCKWLATDLNGSIFGYSAKPLFRNNIWVNELFTNFVYLDVSSVDFNSFDSLYEIPPKLIYPKWVIKAAKHHKFRWIAADASGAVFAYEDKPHMSENYWSGARCVSVISTQYPLNLSVDWTESLYEVK